MVLVMRIVAGDLPDLERIDLSRLMHWIVPGQALSVGRDASRADVAIGRDAYMSTLHFCVAGRADGYWIRDLSSRHGTFVNGQRIHESKLHDGDIILAGETTFQVGWLDASGEPGGRAGSAAGREEPPGAGTPAQPLQVVLKIASGPSAPGERGTLTNRLSWITAGRSLRVGRTDKADLVVANDPQISSLHFEIACDDHDVLLRDLNSRNGTLVNGRGVQAAQLQHGDEIQAGTTRFRVAVLGRGEPPWGEASRTPSATPLVSAPPAVIADGSTEIYQPARKPAPPQRRDTPQRPATPERPGTPERPDTHERPGRGPGLSAEESAPLAPMQVVVTVVRGPAGEVADGYTSRLVAWLGAGQTVRIGRRAAAVDLAVRRDPKMSGLHFQLSCDGRYCRLEDLHSRNGTYVNGRRVREAVLQDRDEIQAGDTIFGVAICGGVPLSGTFLEFAAVGHRPEELPSSSGGLDLQLPDMDAAFAAIKARLRARY